jgi:four helix bundle protein
MNSKIRTFEDLIVWQKAIAFVKQAYLITEEGGLKRDFGLKDQIRRAAVSSPQILLRVLSVRHAKNTCCFLISLKVQQGK